MGHDQRFKEFLQTFLQEFLELFYPEVEKRLDFKDIEFLDKELFTEVSEGSRREADLVAKLGTRQGGLELVLIHIEVQTERKRNVSARMFEYFALLWSRHKLPIFPVVVYLRGGKDGIETERFHMDVFEHEVLRFQYESVRLARLDVEEYRKKGGPIAAALGALMDRSGHRNPAELRASLVLRVAESGLDSAQEFLLMDLIGTYFALTDAEIEHYEELISREEYRKVQDVELTWADKLMLKGEEKGLEIGLEKGRQKGREEGLRAGLVEGKRQSVLRVLEAKFGSVSPEVRARLESMKSVDELDACLERAAKASSLEETGLDA